MARQLFVPARVPMSPAQALVPTQKHCAARGPDMQASRFCRDASMAMGTEAVYRDAIFHPLRVTSTTACMLFIVKNCGSRQNGMYRGPHCALKPDARSGVPVGPPPGRVGHDEVLPGPVLGVRLGPGAAEHLVDLGLRAHEVALELRLVQDLLGQALRTQSERVHRQHSASFAGGPTMQPCMHGSTLLWLVITGSCSKSWTA